MSQQEKETVESVSNSSHSMLSSVFRRIRWRQSSREEAIIAEKELLSLSPDAQLEGRDLRIGPGKHDYMHYVQGGMSNTTSPHLVALAGYGGGAGFKFRILEGLAAGFRLWAVDFWGTGLSGRPKFTANTTHDAENFFVESLEKWREKAGIDKMVLLGHSMGGYLSAVYALRYPERVQHLILVCPAGIGRKPDDWKPPESLRSPWTVRGQVFRLAMSLWDAGLTPGIMVRALGPYGPRLAKGYTKSRFQNGHGFNDEEARCFANYSYAILAARGSGEHALRYILEPFAFPRSPLEYRLDKLQVPITFIYGDKDWMDPRAAHRVVSKLRESRGPFEADSDLKVLITRNAGHYNFTDQPGEFLNQILESVGHYLGVEQRKAVERAAAKWPFRPGDMPGDTKQQLQEEMSKHPAAAEAHVATDL